MADRIGNVARRIEAVRLRRGLGILLHEQAALRFRQWQDTRTTPRPGEPDITADLVAALGNDARPDQPWLLVFEFQAEHDPDKLDITLAEVARLRLTVRHGDDRRGKYNVLVALVYLRGTCPERVLDMTLPGGWGTLQIESHDYYDDPAPWFHSLELAANEVAPRISMPGQSSARQQAQCLAAAAV